MSTFRKHISNVRGKNSPVARVVVPRARDTRLVGHRNSAGFLRRVSLSNIHANETRSVKLSARFIDIASKRETMPAITSRYPERYTRMSERVVLVPVDTLFIINFVNSVNARVQLRARVSLRTLSRGFYLTINAERHLLGRSHRGI